MTQTRSMADLGGGWTEPSDELASAVGNRRRTKPRHKRKPPGDVEWLPFLLYWCGLLLAAYGAFSFVLGVWSWVDSEPRPDELFDPGLAQAAFGELQAVVGLALIVAGLSASKWAKA